MAWSTGVRAINVMNNYQIKRINEILRRPNLLTATERILIESLSDMPEDKELTEKQNHKLNKIAEKMG